MRERPYVLLSVAMSADGYIDDASGTRLVLSDEADLDRVDELRARCDAILVGAQTIRADNPSLGVRSVARQRQRTERGLTADPRKVTLTRSGDVDPRARFFTAVSPAPAGEPPLVYAVQAAAAELTARLIAVAVVVTVPAPGPEVSPGTAGLDLRWILADLAARGVGRLMIEGGAQVLSQFLSAGLADELLLAVAPIFVADAAAPRLLAGPGPGGRMRLAGVRQAGDMAVLRYVPRTGGPG